MVSPYRYNRFMNLADHTSLSETDTTGQAADEGIYGVFK